VHPAAGGARPQEAAGRRKVLRGPLGTAEDETGNGLHAARRRATSHRESCAAGPAQRPGNDRAANIISAWPPPWRPRALAIKNPRCRVKPDQWRINASASVILRV